MINENKMKPRYLPIDPDYIELIEEQIKKGDTRVIYFAFSKEPEFTPILIGIFLLKQAFTTASIFSSLPIFPGFMRILSTPAAAHSRAIL